MGLLILIMTPIIHHRTSKTAQVHIRFCLLQSTSNLRSLENQVYLRNYIKMERIDVRTNCFPSILISAFWAFCTIGRLRHIRSFDTKTAPGISREPFDLEWPNFTWTYRPTYSIATTDKTSLCGFGRKVQRKNCRKYPFRRRRAELLENGSSEDDQVVRTSRGQSASQTYRKRHHQRLPVGCKM